MASSQTQDVYANPDGTYTRRVYLGRVNYKAVDGVWTPIDTTLVAERGGRYYTEKANDVDVAVASSAADPALVSVAGDSRHVVTFGLQGAADVEAVVDGDTATYPSVFPGVDLVESPTVDGIKESLVLRSAEVGSSWLFPLRLKGLVPRIADDGSVEFTDSTGEVVQTFPHGFMQDSKVAPTSGLAAISTGVAYSLETTAGGDPALRVSVDQAWLADPARVFPVTVDPTSAMGTSSTTYVETLVPGPHNGEAQIQVGTWDGGTHKARSFLGFTGFEGVFAGKRMTSVTLSVFDSWATNCTDSTSFQVGMVTQAWSSSALRSWPGPAVGGSTSAPGSIGYWKGRAPSAACGNTSGDRSVGAYITTNPLNVNAFNSWIGGTVPNYGLALFTSETDTNQWKVFDSNNRSAQQPILNVTYTPDVAPQVDSQYPPNNYATSTLTPELLAYGHDPDTAPNPLQYLFSVYTAAGALVARSGLRGSGSWVVPSGKLAWGQTYVWTVQTFDGVLYSSSAPRWYALSTPVPQPLVTSGLSQSVEGHGFEPSVGNYTTSVTDAEVSTVGPSLSVERGYNSLDGRRAGAFGTGWSSVYDTRAGQVRDHSGTVQTVVVTYPEGQEVAFGRNADGSFSPPPGRFATLRAVDGGYTLTDKNDTVYTFTQALAAETYGVTAVADALGRTERFTYGSGHITRVTAASGRHLDLGWSTPDGATFAHVATVTTDPATAGEASTATTWTYGYDGDELTSVCPPTSATACTRYAYSSSTSYPETVQDAGPESYWRLGEESGATRAVSSVLANEGTDNATYSGVRLGGPGSLPGSAATSAAFDGSSSVVGIDKQLALGATYQSLALRFKADHTSGVLFSYQADPLSAGTTSGNYTPALYVGTDGTLYGQFWTGTVAPIPSTGVVNDGDWHEVVLVGAGNTQSMYVDGELAGTRSGQIRLKNGDSLAHVYVGSGFIGGSWPSQPHYSTTSGKAWPLYFAGSISDVSFFARPLTEAEITAMAAAGGHEARVLTTVTRPSGSVYASVAYDTAACRVSQVTDENGAVRTLSAPTVSGSSGVYESAVLGAGPRNYWRFGEHSATDAVNEVNGESLSYVGGVTLDTAGRFADATAATFDGRSGYADAAGPLVVDGGNQSISLWFTTTHTGGVLASYHAEPLTDGTTPGNYTPLLYVGTDGKLYGEYWQGHTTPIVSPGTVNDGAWHHVVLAAGTTSQSLYLDGTAVGTLSGTVALYDASGADHGEIGAGFNGGNWPAASGSAGTARFFAGSISDVATFRSQLTAAQVAQQYAAANSSGGVMPATTVMVTDPSGNQLRYVTDTRNGNRPVAQTDALGSTTRYGYDTSGFLRTVTDPNGNVVTTGHDVRGNTVSQTTCQDRSENKCSTVYYGYYPDATSTSLDPDPRNDVLVTVRDARSSSATDDTYLTTYTYDAHGNRTGVTTPPVRTDGSSSLASRTTTTTYTTASTVAVDGGTTPAGLPETVTTPAGALTRYAYFTSGDLARITDPVGLVTAFTYDGLGRQLTVSETWTEAGTDPGTDPAVTHAATAGYEYDRAGRVVVERSPAFTNRVTGAVHTPVTTTTFDVDGNVTEQTVADATGGDATRTVSSTYDGHARQASATDATGAVTTFGYDVYGNLSGEVGPTGVETRYASDPNGHLLTVTLVGYTGDPSDPSDPADVVESARAYDPAGRLASITDAMGRRTMYTYTDDGLLTKAVRLPPGQASSPSFVLQQNAFDAAGNIVSQTTNNGTTTTTFTLDAAGRTVSATLDPAGLDRTTTYTYTADDAVASTTLTDSSSTWSSLTARYDAAGRAVRQALAGSVDPDHPSVTTWTRDQRGQPVSVTDPLGNVTEYTFDEAGQPAVRVDPAVETTTGGAVPVVTRAITTTGYDTFGSVSEVSDPNGNTTTYGYDAEGRPVTETLPGYTPPDGTQTVTAVARQAYNGLGQVTEATDPLGHTTGYAYDQLGDPVSVTAPNGAVTHTTYDLAGEALSVTDANGAVTEATYDYLGRQITATQVERRPSPAAYTTEYTYCAGGWPASQTSPAGVTTSATYDADGQMATSTDGAGNTTRYGHDLAGRTTVTQAPDGTRNRVTYDDAGDPVRVADEDPAGTVLRSSSATFDEAGNLTSLTNARGYTSTFTYNAVNALTGEVQPVSATASITTSFGYDAAGNRTRYTDGRGNDWLTTFTPWNLPESQIEPATTAYPGAAERTYTTTYDANGNRTRVDLPGGVQVHYTYDEVGDLTRQTGSGAEAVTQARAFGYDKTGQLTSASAPGGTDTFAYDDRGLLLSAAGPSGASQFTYTADGQLASRTDAAGATSYGYDGAGRLVSLTDPLTSTTATFSYNSLSQPTRIDYGAGQDVRAFGYDALHRLVTDTLTTSGGATVAGITYGYDVNDNITTKTATGFTGPDTTTTSTSTSTSTSTNATTSTYFYDRADRLVSWDNGSTTVGYAFDAAGNLTRAGSMSYAYDARNELTGDGTRTFSYTARGTLSGIVSADEGTQTAAFDAFGQAVTQGGRTYTYDALGRVVTTEGGSTGSVTMAYSGAGNTLACDGRATYTRDPGGGLVAVGSVGTGVLAFVDQHDDVVGQFGAAGEVLSGASTFDPFGVVTATAGMVGGLGYQSGWTDPVTDRVTMGTRWYDPGQSRFISHDSVRLDPVPASGAANAFAYADGNPLAVTDPDGTWGIRLPDVLTRVVSSVGHAAVSAGRTVARAAVSVGRTVARAAVSVGRTVARAAAAVYSAAKHVAKTVARTTVRAVKTVTRTVSTKVSDAKKTIRQYAHVVTQATARAVTTAVKKTTAVVRSVTTAYQKSVVAARKAVAATDDFIKHHAGAIVSTVVTVAVFAGCEAVLGGLTAGAGAVAGAMACGALAGAVGGALGDLADVAAGNTQYSWKSLAVSAGIGALAGAVGGAVGAGVGVLAKAGASLLARTGTGRAVLGLGDRLASTGLGQNTTALGRAGNTLLSSARTRGTRTGTALHGALPRGGTTTPERTVLEGTTAETAGSSVAAESGTVARFVAGSDGTVTDLVGTKNAISLGHGDAYFNDAMVSGSRALKIPDEAWRGMSAREQMVRNQRFLDDAIRQGSEIRLATSYADALPNSIYRWELDYLESRGYAPNVAGTRMIR